MFGLMRIHIFAGGASQTISPLTVTEGRNVDPPSPSNVVSPDIDRATRHSRSMTILCAAW
jgi:hypothetical protein